MKATKKKMLQVKQAERDLALDWGSRMPSSVKGFANAEKITLGHGWTWAIRSAEASKREAMVASNQAYDRGEHPFATS